MRTLAALASFLSLATLALHAQTVQVEDPAGLAKVIATNATLTKLAGNMKFIEGPVWLARDGGSLVFSDIPANELKSWSESRGVATFRSPSGNANGNTRDRQGRLITCEHSGRRVARTELDGTVKTLVDRFEGKRFNSPNDAVVGRDGVIWFTDPDYGLPRNSEREYGGCWVFRFEPERGDLRVAARDFDRPNGIALSPDGRILYVADSGKPRHLRAFDVRPDGSLTNGRVFAAISPGVPDGIRCDAEGRVWSSAGDGVQIFAPDGKLLGRILVPESPANLCFGGADGQTLFITARTALYCVPVRVRGAD